MDINKLKSEEEIFQKFLKLKPKQYDRTEYYTKSNKKGRDKVNLFSWISGENNDDYISLNSFEKVLNSYGLTLQIYYDLIVLNLKSLNDRPKCIICGKPLKFLGFNVGYSKTCSDECYIKYKGLSNVYSPSIEEEALFNKFNSLNPNKGVKYDDFYYESDKLDSRGKTLRYYKLYNWISGESDDKYILSNLFPKELKKYGITSQIYYDLVILGITNIMDRPKCLVCGNFVKFRGLFEGYKSVCSEECFKKLSCDRIISYGKLSIHHSEDTKRKLSIISTGRKHSDRSKRRMSEDRKGKKKNFSKEFIDKLVESNKSRVWTKESREKISIASTNRLLNNELKPNQFKRGWFNSDIFGNIHFDSSWEEKFIKICESLYRKGHILEFSRCNDIILYKTDDDVDHRYLPDFKLKLYNSIEVVIELKPASLVKNDRVVFLKKMAAMKYYKSRNIKYIILTENELFKNINGSFNIFDYVV